LSVNCVGIHLLSSPLCDIESFADIRAAIQRLEEPARLPVLTLSWRGSGRAVDFDTMFAMNPSTPDLPAHFARDIREWLANMLEGSFYRDLVRLLCASFTRVMLTRCRRSRTFSCIAAPTGFIVARRSARCCVKRCRAVG
jgi:hypothetical protein